MPRGIGFMALVGVVRSLDHTASAASRIWFSTSAPSCPFECPGSSVSKYFPLPNRSSLFRRMFPTVVVVLK